MTMFNFNLYSSLSLLHPVTSPICASHFYSPATCFSPINVSVLPSKSECSALKRFVWTRCISLHAVWLYIFPPLCLFPATSQHRYISIHSHVKGNGRMWGECRQSRTFFFFFFFKETQAVVDQDREVVKFQWTFWHWGAEEMWRNQSITFAKSK